MGLVREIRDEIVVAGWSCKLPGANSISELWSLLREGRCAVTQVPEDRFSLQRYLHPRRQERGKSYTFRAGVLDDIWGFDPTIFGISPREAEQMDPQQRLLLQLTWEALEDAGIRPSSIAGEEVGVFVGGSLTDYSHPILTDQSIGDAYFATGNALAALSNRISYCFNLKGPSMTVDTACSSSLVALHQAVSQIRSGRIDTAIVAGVNIIGSPMSFITFSQASMLSPTGLCHAFDSEADGFVRAEGGAVVVLRRASLAKRDRNPVHGVIIAADVNSDGRTGGMALPSWEAQHALLDRIYGQAGVDPAALAFVEAHGTGTAVGDPAEARALGQGLGQKRRAPLSIGSIKTNIGHLEPAAGLSGLLKALLALNHELLPASLHFKNPNPHIDFSNLNLNVCGQAMALPDARSQFAGVNSFGFGGTNAHVIVAAGRPAPPPVAANPGPEQIFTISAETKQALADLAGRYVTQIEPLAEDETAIVAAAAAWRREALRHRLVISGTGKDNIVSALKAFGAGDDHPLLTAGQASGEGLATAFVFSGNGGQRAGMGVALYKANAGFRARFDRIDGYFTALAGWSLKDAMLDPALGERIHLTHVAQPLIFAIQSAMAGCLRSRGVIPAAVLGHSVGEVAAAEAAGIIDTASATRIIYYRSKHQELAQGAGGMAVIAAPADIAAELLAGIADVELAAHNSPRAVTVAGTRAGLGNLKRVAQSRGIAFIDLNLNYPFHTWLMAPLKDILIEDLRGLTPAEGTIPFVSTVTGAPLSASDLGADYWWHNVRQPVRFAEAIAATAKLGIRSFIEISPTSVLAKHISDCLIGETQEYVVLSCPDARDSDAAPFDRVVARALIAGSEMEESAVFGPDPGGTVQLPFYPWQKVPYRYKPTVEAREVVEKDRHILSGVRSGTDALEWHSHIDTALIPELGDHQVGGRVVFPGTGFLEIVLSVAAQVLGTRQLNLRNIEILRPLDLSEEKTHEVSVRLSPASNVIEIFSRPRLSASDWALNCRCKIFRAEFSEPPDIPTTKGRARGLTGEALYRIGRDCGLNYGPSFRQCARLAFYDEDVIAVELKPAQLGSAKRDYLLDPVRTDACVQGFIALLPELKAAERGLAYIPVRVDDILLLQAGQTPQRALIKVLRKSEHSILANTDILGEDGSLIASLRGVRFRAVPVRRQDSLETVGLFATLALADRALLGESEFVPGADVILAAAKELTSTATEPDKEASRLREQWALSVSHEIVVSLARGRTVDLEQIAREQRLSSERMVWLVHALQALEKTGLVSSRNGNWELHKEASLPSSSALLKSFMDGFPDRAAEILAMSEMSGLAARIAAQEKDACEPFLSGAVLEFLRVAAAETANKDDALWKLLQHNVLTSDRTMRVLQVGAGPITRNLITGDVAVTILEPSESRLNRAQLSAPRRGDLIFANDLTPALGQFDLVIACDGLGGLPPCVTPSGLRDFVAPGGMLAGFTGKPSLFHDLVFGPGIGLASGDAAEDVMLRAELEGAGFIGVQTSPVTAGTEEVTLFLAAQPLAANKPATEPARFRTLAVNDAWAHSVRARLLQTKGGDREDWQAAETIVQILSGGQAGVSETDVLIAQCLTLKELAQQAEKDALIVLVFNDALGANPVSAGIWAFARTLANEFSGLDFKRIDIAAGVPAAHAAREIARILNAKTAETELRIESGALRVVRVDSIRRRPPLKGRPRALAARLELSQSPGGRVEWKACRRGAPRDNEIEIAVEATGLNFRDLIWAMRLLPDDILEDGCTGPTLGLECAGRVVRVGSEAERFEIGDRVVTMTGNAFSTHITVGEHQAEKLPSGISFEAAATIPVTFLTAYYSLVTLANLQPGEWVLVHGGAGGVGLAAIQIAKSLGGRVIATAGSRAKRDLLKRMGADHVLDSRSMGFVENVRKLTRAGANGGGANVILNSLALEAMEQSLNCLAPFGRFVELGKRDYVADTQIGVRVFRRNASYFGVDVDQLMTRGDLGSQLLKKIMKEFKKGSFKPLPHTVFEASGVVQAFGLMQQSAHVGKIVVHPPSPDAIPAAHKAFQVDRAGTHLVTGAFRGLGLETAKWLVERGARNLVLLSRSGPVGEEALAALQDFSERGVTVLCEQCDVADRAALEAIFAKARAQLPPIVGIIHSAMVLDDSLIANLDEARFHTVLAPKVAGARHLDGLSRDLALDYFVLFSSVTTLMGNPGQGNYVAANAFLEGLARERRGQGLPALAIGWGPITDVGVVARSEKLKMGLKRLTGARGMTSREALALMSQALDLSGTDPRLAVMTIAPNDGSFGDDRLKVLRSPTYAPVLRARGTSQEANAEAIDILALAKTMEAGMVARKVGDLLVEHLSRVLHAPEDTISRTRPLGEIGLDSLMAVELGMNIQEIFGVSIPLAGSSASLTVVALAEKIVSQIMGSAVAEAPDPIPVLLAPANAIANPANDVGLLGDLLTQDLKFPAE